MREVSMKSRNSGIAMGSVLVLLGIALILMNIGVIEHVHLWHFWPLILVFIGLGKFFGHETGREKGSGIGLILLGAWFQMVTLNAFGLTYGNSWPVLLIIWGLSLTGHALIPHPHMTLAKENGNGQ